MHSCNYVYVSTLLLFFILFQWAFGVTCWEIFSLGLQPYPTVDPFQMGDYLKGRNVLDKPSLSSDEM